MPFPRPTLTALRTRVASYISSALPGADALLRYSNLGITGEVIAAESNGHYGYLDWIAKQAVPFTATGEYLEAWASLKGVTRKPATSASGLIRLAGTDGTVLPSGTPVTRSDGNEYVTAGDATVAGGFVTATLSTTTTGAITNAPTGAVLTLGTAVAGITSTGAASGPLTGGSDVESDDDLRTRMLAVYASPPQGGDADDYVEWALEAPGVTRAWTVRNGMGIGTVVVFFMMDEAEAVHGGFPQGANGVAADEVRDTPAGGDQLIVANYIYPVQPVTALVYAVAPQPNTLAFTIAGIPSASGSVKAAISVAIAGALAGTASPGGVTELSAIEGGIAAVPGSAGFVITIITASAGTVSPGTSGNITSDAGHLPTLGAVTYI